jgi:CRISPR-associated protein Cmr2
MKYIALTLGPITDTLMLGRKTSEIWMASYLFSSFMKKVIDKIRKKDGVEFLVPYVKNDSIFEIKDDGIGMFHDRFILKSETLCIEDVQKILQEEKENLAQMIAQSIKKDEHKVKAFIQEYLQTYLFESEEQFENPILDISSILDSIELHIPRLEAEEDYIRLFLNRDTLLNSQLAKESFGKKPSFESIEAIAAQENDDDEFQAKNAQKYIAIIHADGDNLGAYIKSKKDSVSEISHSLFEFDSKAIKTIDSFGAIALFIGGDDLLIFAPLINSKKETLFDLINTLSEDYQNTLETDKSTLSFGVSITYYKYPLYEALEKSRKALFEVAKNYADGRKNAVAISAQKHSGQSFDFCISKDEAGYKEFTELVNHTLNSEIELPHAIHHKLYNHKSLFEHIEDIQIEDTFKNIFNEEIHKAKFEKGLSNVQNLMQTLGLKQQMQEKLFSMLSTIKLLRGDR